MIKNYSKSDLKDGLTSTHKKSHPHRTPEWQIQTSYVHWASFNPVLRELLISIPNEGKRSWRMGKRLKDMGLRPGTHDLFLPFPCGGKHGLWMEVKAEGEKPRREQIEWARKMIEQGFAAGWSNNLEGLIVITQTYFAAREVIWM